MDGRIVPETDIIEWDSDRARLHQLGYKQELKRHLSVVSSFAFSFSMISVLTGITTLYNTSLTFGGPLTATMGWVVVSVFNALIALSMAEICSAYPTSGGLYYWSATLAGGEWAPLASWVTGWFIVVGQCATTASVDFSLAQLLQVIILLGTGGANGGGYLASKYVVMGFHGGILLLHGAINSLSVDWLSVIGQFGAACNGFGVVVLTVLVPAVATQRADTRFVFTHFNTDNGAGIHNDVYIFVLGLLMSQYTMSGYDVSAHMSEETKGADRNGPKAIITAVSISAVTGWAYLIAISYTVTNIPNLLSDDNDAGGYAIAEVFYLVFKNRFGSGSGGVFCLGIVALALFFCGISLVTNVSRITYAFSRDGAMPFSYLWHKVNRHDVPINAVWLTVLASFCMALTSLGSLVAFQAMASIATIGVYVAYALPILFRVTLGRKSFARGPFSLGRFGVPVGWIAVLWVATITVLFSLPVAYPVTKDTLNYTPVALGIVLVLVLSSWVLSARYWFKGPISHIEV